MKYFKQNATPKVIIVKLSEGIELQKWIAVFVKSPRKHSLN